MKRTQNRWRTRNLGVRDSADMPRPINFIFERQHAISVNHDRNSTRRKRLKESITPVSSASHAERVVAPKHGVHVLAAHVISLDVDINSSHRRPKILAAAHKFWMYFL